MDGRRKLVAVRKCPYVDLNVKVFDWFCSARARNIPLTGRLLKAKASEISRMLDLTTVKKVRVLFVSIQSSIII